VNGGNAPQFTVGPPLAGGLRQGWFESILAGDHFVRRYPHYAGVLARMDPTAANTVPLMAICLRRWDNPRSRLQLLVNLDYFLANPQYRAGVPCTRCSTLSWGI
jgi:hypothetical protein